MDLLPFDAASINAVPAGAGVYVVYKGGRAFYVGRSRVDIRRRLRSHFKGTGSQKIASEPTGSLKFEYCEMGSAEHAEALLMMELGTRKLGNMRVETDPSEWKFPCRSCTCADYQDRSNGKGGYPTVEQVAEGHAVCRCGHSYEQHE
jgi:predicted GIY-YIG superfamily endonuclease